MSNTIPVGKLREFLAIQPQKKKFAFSESKLQQECVKWFDATYSGVYTFWLVIKTKKKGIKVSIEKPVRVSMLIMLANAGKRSKFGGGLAVAEGLSTGAADLFLSVPQRKITTGNKMHYGLYLETKVGTNSQSVAQKEFQRIVEAMGYKYVVYRTFDEFKTTIENYL